jgi:hypothetical protein
MTGVAVIPFLSFAGLVSVSEPDRTPCCRSDAGISQDRLIPADAWVAGGGAGRQSLHNAVLSVVCTRRAGEAPR